MLSPDEVHHFRGELEAWEHSRCAPIDRAQKSNSRLMFNWADQLLHRPDILDAVEDVIGPDILVYRSTMFLEEPVPALSCVGTRTAPTSTSSRICT